MIGQKGDLRLQKHNDRSGNKGNPSNETQREPADPFALTFRADEKLENKKRVQALPHTLPLDLDPNLSFEELIVCASLASEGCELQENVEVGNDKDDRRHDEKADKREIDV